MTAKRKSPQAIEFGRRLFDRRRELKLTQQEVADAAGIHRTLLSDYERDAAPERTPTDETLRGLGKALDVPEATMFEWANVRHPSVSAHMSNSTPPEMLEMVGRLLEQLAESNRQNAELLRRLADVGGSEPPPRRRRPKPSS